MKSKRRFGAALKGFLGAFLFTTLLGTVVQTQVNLAHITAIGPPVDLHSRFQATIHDLIYFSPAWAMIVFATFVVAFPVAHLLARLQWRQLFGWCGVAGAIGLWLAFILLDQFTPPPTLIGATRGTPGTLLMVGTGMMGGFLYAWIYRHCTRTQAGH